MDIQIKEDSSTDYPNLGTYRSLELTAGKTTALVILRSKTPTVTVLVTSNVNTAVWKSLGKDYPSIAAAQAHYRSPAMKAILDRCTQLVAV